MLASAAPGPTWATVMTGLGGGAASLAFIGGALVALRYGRRASVILTADAHVRDGRVVVSTRPVVKAVGIFKVSFHKNRGAVVRVTELYLDAAGELQDARFWEKSDIFGQEFVDPGEELPTTTVFPLPSPIPASVVGWRVSVKIKAPTRFLASSSGWADQVFVPRPGDLGVACVSTEVPDAQDKAPALAAATSSGESAAGHRGDPR